VFDGAARVSPGTYTVIWREQKPPVTGKWRIIDAAQVTVTAQDMQYPPAPVIPAAGPDDEAAGEQASAVDAGT
jgi:hypothetical protein